MIQHDFLGLVRSREFDALTSAWDEAAGQAANLDPQTVETLSQTILQLCDRSARDTALDLATRMVNALEQADKLDAGIRIGVALIRKEAHNEPFARQILAIIAKKHGEEDWFQHARQIANLTDESPAPDAFLKFDRARRLTPGHVVNHRAGWGDGLVKGYETEDQTIEIEFHDGLEKRFPLAKAVDSLRPVDDDDLRAMRLREPEKLTEIAESDPSVLLRMAAKIFRGTINSAEVKAQLSPSVIPTKKWATWWKKAKVAASQDPWLEIGGSKTRPVFELRKQPLSFADEAKRRLDHSQNVHEVLVTVRNILQQGVEEDSKNTLVDLAQQRIEEALQLQSEQGEDDQASKVKGAAADAPAHLLDGILFLEEHGRTASVSAAEELGRMLRGENGLEPEALDELESKEAHELATKLIPDALGDTWADECVATITRFPATDVERVVNLLQEAGAAPRLAPVWQQIAPFPKKHPVLTYLLGRLHADGFFKDVENAPDRISVARVLLHLLRLISMEPKSNTELMRLKSRITNAMVGRRAILTEALEELGRDDLAAFLGITERASEDFPQEVVDAILKVVARKYPDITSKPDKPFWELDDYIYVTKPGYERRKEEHRVLVDVDIPKNAEAIGAAASLGDLSENSEWEAAMEEQRNLTGRAQEMTEELRRARLIEDQEIPEDLVAPGTRVTYTVLDDQGQQAEEPRTVRLLGPWDCVEDDILNYRAPMARAILGKKIGDEGQFRDRSVRVDAIARIE